jgi:hypothetical protein
MIKIEHTPTGQIIINGKLLAKDPLDLTIGGPLEELMENVLETEDEGKINKGVDTFTRYYKENSADLPPCQRSSKTF